MIGRLRPSGGTLSAWVQGGPADQARFREMSARLVKSHYNGMTIGLTTGLVSFWSGPGVLGTVLAAHVIIAAGIVVVRSGRGTAETVTASAFVALQASMATAVLLSGGATSPLLVLTVIPMFSQGVCFRPPVMLAGSAVSVLLSCAAVAGAELLPPVPAPPGWVYLCSYLALTGSLSVCAIWLANAHRSSRDDAGLDPLTGLFNRKSLPDWFAATQAQARAHHGVLVAIMVDVDHFKAVNDTHGHQHGDLVLTAVAERLRGAVRQGTPVFRFGGEEFLVLLSVSRPEDVHTIGERLRAQIAADPVVGLTVTVSVGISSADGSPELADLLKAADGALYEAKGSGRDCVRLAVVPDQPAGQLAATG